MRRVLAAALPVAGCAEAEGPDLLAGLTGAWTGELAEATLARTPAVLLVGPAGEGARFARVRSFEPEGPRDYALAEAWAVGDLGAVLELWELGGVRRLTLTLPAPFEEPLLGGWSALWACDQEPDGRCEQEGVVPWVRAP